MERAAQKAKLLKKSEKIAEDIKKRKIWKVIQKEKVPGTKGSFL